MTRSAFHHEPRERLTDQERARLFFERGGKCHRCGRTIRAGEKWSDEHVIALENGGTNAWGNRALTCAFCKGAKDGEDHKKAGHSRRVATRHVVPNASRQKSALSKRDGYRFDWKTKRYVRDDDNAG